MPGSERLSIRGYARHRGITEGAVRKALAKGKITAEDDGRIDPERADREWQANTRAQVRTDPAGAQPVGTHEAAAPTVGTQALTRDLEREVARAAASSETKLEAERRKEVALANIRERQDAREAGELVDRQTVARAWFAVCRTTRDQFLAVRERVEVRLGLTTEQLDVLTAELRAVLGELTKQVPGLGDSLPENVDL